METDAQRVRQVLARELETISHYEALAAAAERPELRAFFLHLAEEEKEHVAEATLVLRRLDSGQDLQLQKPFPASHFDATAGPKAPAAAPGTPAAAQAGFSVGPLGKKPSPPGKPIAHARQALYATPAPPAPHGDQLTVGSLRGPHA